MKELRISMSADSTDAHLENLAWEIIVVRLPQSVLNAINVLNIRGKPTPVEWDAVDRVYLGQTQGNNSNALVAALAAVTGTAQNAIVLPKVTKKGEAQAANIRGEVNNLRAEVTNLKTQLITPNTNKPVWNNNK